MPSQSLARLPPQTCKNAATVTTAPLEYAAEVERRIQRNRSSAPDVITGRTGVPRTNSNPTDTDQTGTDRTYGDRIGAETIGADVRGAGEVSAERAGIQWTDAAASVADKAGTDNVIYPTSTDADSFVVAVPKARMLPVTFGDCFGWLHPGGRTCGVVLCGPIGFEKQVFHRSLRIMADRLGEAGYSTLRFDYPGTGDAAGIGGALNEQEAWLSGIEAATAWLRANAGVTRVVLCGVELGALLAGVAAARMGGVDQLVLVAPVTSGRQYVRTFRLAARLSAVRLLDQSAGCSERHVTPRVEQDSSDSPGGAGHHRCESGREVAQSAPLQAADACGGLAEQITEAYGLRLHETTLRALARLDLSRLSSAPAHDILLLDATGLDSVKALGAALADGGATLTLLDMPDYLDMARQAHESELPIGSLDRILAWLQQADTPAAAPVSLPGAVLPAMRGSMWTERPVMLDSRDGKLVAVLCRPAIPAQANVDGENHAAVLIVNTGANPRYGYGRFAVTLARALAGDGVMSLRLDLAGLGDSVLEGVETRPHLFADRSPDIAAGLAFLAAQGAPASIGFGICSGAFQIFRAALSDRRLCGLVLVNQPLYRPPAGMRFPQVARLRARFRQLQGKPQPEVDVALEQLRLIPPVRKRTRLQAGLIRAARMVEDALLRPFGAHTALSFPRRMFEQLASRRVSVLVVAGDNDPAHLILQAHFGPKLAGLRRIAAVDVTIEPEFDHPVGDFGSQQRLLAATLSFLALRTGACSTRHRSPNKT